MGTPSEPKGASGAHSRFSLRYVAVAIMVVLVLYLSRPPSSRYGSEPPPTATGTNEPAITPKAPTNVPSGSEGATVPTPIQDPRKPLPNPLRPAMLELLARLDAEPDPIRRDEMAREALGKLRDEDLQAALAVVSNPEFGRNASLLLSKLLERWVRLDPSAAAGWVGLMASGNLRTESIGRVAASWSSSQPTEAIAWVRSLSESGERQNGLIQIAYQLAGSDPLKALSLAPEFLAAPGGEEAIRHATTRWAETDPNQALAWATQIENLDFRDQVLGSLLTAWGDKDPKAAATAAVESMEPGRGQSDAVVGIVQRWAQRDPETASAWVAGFGDGELKASAMEELVRVWSESDLGAAGEWLRTSSVSGDLRDGAVAAYSAKLFESDPGTAAEWVLKIADEERRRAEAARFLERWLLTDGTAARAWAEKAPAGLGLKLPTKVAPPTAP